MLKWFIGSTPWLGTVAQWFSVLTTLGAVIVALFKDEFFRWRNRPILKASIRPGAPDCAKTIIFLKYQESPIGRADCYYLRLWVENVGRGRAQDVQVYVARLYKRVESEEKFAPVERFLPMNLTWAHGQPGQPEVLAKSLASGMGRHCDLGSVVDPKSGPPFYVATPNSPIGQCYLALSVEAPPTTGNNILEPGTYLVELRIAGSNSSRVTYLVEIALAGRWFDDSEEMLSSGVTAKVLDSNPFAENA